MAEVLPFEIVSLMIKNIGRMVKGSTSFRGTDCCVSLPNTHRSRDTIAFSLIEEAIMEDKT